MPSRRACAPHAPRWQRVARRIGRRRAFSVACESALIGCRGGGRRNRSDRGSALSRLLYAQAALLPDGWARNVAIDIDATGKILSVQPEAIERNAEMLARPAIPAMPNVHSHAFQRAPAGRTGRAAASHD